jgi:hypothetical protein
MAQDLKSLLGKPSTSWQDLAQAALSSQQKNKDRKRKAMLIAFLGNFWESRNLAAARDEIGDFEASGAVEKARQLQYANDRLKLLDMQKAIEGAGTQYVDEDGITRYTGQYVVFRPDGEAAFDEAHKSTLHLYDPTNPTIPRTNLEAKEEWIKKFIDENKMKHHQDLYAAWEFDKETGTVYNADNKVLSQNIVKPASFNEFDEDRGIWIGPKGQTWEQLGRLRDIQQTVYTGSADELTRLRAKYASRPGNISWMHQLGEKVGLGRSYDDTLSKIEFEEGRLEARRQRYLAAQDVVTVNKQLEKVSANKLDSRQMSKEIFNEYARGYLANRPLLIKSAVQQFDQKIKDGYNTTGNARAILQAHVDDAEWLEKDIQMNNRIERMERLANTEGWSSDEIENQREYIIADSLGVSTAIIEKRMEISSLAKEGIAMGIFGDPKTADIDEITKNAWETQLIAIFGNSTKTQAYQGALQVAMLDYAEDFRTNKLDSVIIAHLGSLDQKDTNGEMIYRSWDFWKARGISFEMFKSINDRQFKISRFNDTDAEYKILFDFKAEQHRLLYSSNAALYATSMAEMVDQYQKQQLIPQPQTP